MKSSVSLAPKLFAVNIKTHEYPCSLIYDKQKAWFPLKNVRAPFSSIIVPSKTYSFPQEQNVLVAQICLKLQLRYFHILVVTCVGMEIK